MPSDYGDDARLQIGNLNYEANEEDLRSKFSRYGKVTRCDIKKGYGFIHMADKNDAEDAVKKLDNSRFEHREIQVQFCHGKGPRRREDFERSNYEERRRPKYSHSDRHYDREYRDKYEGYRTGTGQRVMVARGKYRVEVSNLSSNTTQQDLKDYARRKENYPVFAECQSESSKYYGALEFDRYRDLEHCLDSIDNSELDGSVVKAYKVSRPSGSMASRYGRKSRSRSRHRSRSRSRSYNRQRRRRSSRSISSNRRNRSRSRSNSRSRKKFRSSSSNKNVSQSRSRSKSSEKNSERISSSRERARDISQNSFFDSRSRSRSKDSVTALDEDKGNGLDEKIQQKSSSPSYNKNEEERENGNDISL